ncbi:hypothetical protein [Streptomyces brevispora]|uniref:hypothetical protein n=1 Tax=Streptomyces brevispora TaxID=887462 RepID=UPI00382CCD2A
MSVTVHDSRWSTFLGLSGIGLCAAPGAEAPERDLASIGLPAAPEARVDDNGWW